MKQVFRLIFAVVVIVTLSKCNFGDYERESTKGLVIDHLTGLPIERALVKDSKYGISELTNQEGKFDIPGIAIKHMIEVTINGYKPFYLEISRDYKEGKYMKTFKVQDVRVNDLGENECKEINSHIFRLINCDSLIIELDRIK